MDSYSLTLATPLLNHFSLRTLLVHDYAEPAKPEVDAKVRSGDYFIMLATALDTLAAELTEISPAATSMALAKLAEELEYVQRHYSVTRKSRPDKLTELH